jgi:Protein of unknown function (DUF1553)/Protein of unknown function (DUF1549)
MMGKESSQPPLFRKERSLSPFESIHQMKSWKSNGISATTVTVRTLRAVALTCPLILGVPAFSTSATSVADAVSSPERGRPSKNPSRPTNHWAFHPPRRPALPTVRHPGWVRNSIDRFVLARLERERIQPSPEADRIALARRLYLDLLGLLPSPAQIDAFLNDSRPEAYEALVDDLLASPHFGERWGRHWLDLARYADSSGYQVDQPRPWAWVYRQWVIDAFNRDLPFDRFTIEQLAGDLLPHATDEEKIATGFHRNTLSNHEDGVDPEEFRCKAKVDRVSTTGTAWLGLTLGCAECHSHKYDPISQREFYQLYAFFDEAEEREVPVKLNPTEETAAGVFCEITNRPVQTFVHVRGDFSRPGEEVEPGVLAVLNPFHPRGPHPDRLDLARWLASPANPLFARVAVNRFWQHLFGQGLVRTPEDFGTRGAPPTHPELLDWLATEFERSGWSRKAVLRLILTSATYRQSSRWRADLEERDPENFLLARQNRFRLEAEIIRDICLDAGALLNRSIGGPSFRPFMPEDVKELGSAGAFHWVDSTGPERYRRGLYIFAQRTVPYPIAMTLDQANPNECQARRERSNTPLQALTLLNHRVFVECAQSLGKRMAGLGSNESKRAIEAGFRICLGRRPSLSEMTRLLALDEAGRQSLKEHPVEAKSLAGHGDWKGFEPAAAASLVSVAQVLLNLDEFMTRE